MKNKDYKNSIEQTTKLLDLWLPLRMQYNKGIGFSIGISHNGKMVYQRSFGYADVEKKLPTTDDTCYNIASVSKLFTAVAIFQLIEKKKLTLATKVVDILPWFRTKSKVSDASKITIEDLLSHRAGIWRDGDTDHWNQDKWPDQKEFIQSFKNGSLIIKNKKNLKYSNFGYGVLGIVIETLSEKTYEDYVKENIFSKAGLKYTSSDYNPSNSNSKFLASGYGKDFPDTGRQKFDHYATGPYAPATGFISNVSDLAKFINSLMKGDLISKKSLKQMTKVYSTLPDKTQYGLGTQIYQVRKKKIVGHSGGFPGFGSKCSFNEETGFSVVLLENNRGTSSTESKGIFDTLFYFLEKNEKPDARLVKYNGIYRSRGSDDILFAVGKKIKIISAEASTPLKANSWVLPVGKKEFVFKSEGLYSTYDEPVTFDVEDGKVNAFYVGPNKSKKIK